jgi:C4-dicarboxylate-binding protein DctP
MRMKTSGSPVGIVRLLAISCMAAATGWQFVSAGPARADEAASPVLRLSTQFQPQSPLYRSVERFKARAQELSAGRVRVEVHAGGELYSDAQAGQAVSSGAIEVATTALYRWADTVPAADFFQLPFLFNSASLEERAAARGSEVRLLVDDALLKTAGVRVLWWMSAGRTHILSKGGAVTSPEKIAGKAVRTAGPVAKAFISQCGGHPKDLSGKQLEKALETHEAEMTVSTLGLISSRQLWRFVDTITLTQHASWQFVAAINEKVWQAMPPQDQDALLAAAEEAEGEARRAISEIEAGALADLAASHGMKAHNLGREDLAAWRFCSSGVLEEYLAKSGALGQQLMRAYGRLHLASPPGPGMAAAPATALGASMAGDTEMAAR